MKKKSSLIILLLVISLSFPVFAFAETIVLKSGKTIEGTMIKRIDKSIKIDVQGVPIMYPLDDVESINGTRLSTVPPKQADAYLIEILDKGEEYYEKGMYDEAIVEYSRAIEINPDDATTINMRAVAYYMKHDYDKAWLDVHKLEALGLEPYSGFLYDLKKASGREK